jgi:hypothetical protein
MTSASNSALLLNGITVAALEEWVSILASSCDVHSVEVIECDLRLDARIAQPAQHEIGEPRR